MNLRAEAEVEQRWTFRRKEEGGIVVESKKQSVGHRRC
jgi:hypothetical protein